LIFVAAHSVMLTVWAASKVARIIPFGNIGVKHALVQNYRLSKSNCYCNYLFCWQSPIFTA
jgi:hypothetical protein